MLTNPQNRRYDDCAMPKPTRTVCWDSCTFVSLIEGTKGRVSALRAVFEEAVQKEIRLIASAVCITEVAFIAPERKQGLSDKTQQDIAKLWLPGSPIVIVEYSVIVARKAQLLLREKLRSGLHLKPLDAIHLATAMQEHADEMHTYDRGLHKWSGFCKMPIRDPRPHQMVLDERNEQKETE